MQISQTGPKWISWQMLQMFYIKSLTYWYATIYNIYTTKTALFELLNSSVCWVQYFHELFSINKIGILLRSHQCNFARISDICCSCYGDPAWYISSLVFVFSSFYVEDMKKSVWKCNYRCVCMCVYIYPATNSISLKLVAW